MAKAKTVEEYIAQNEHWKKELLLLQQIIAAEDLVPAIKWSAPVYSFNGKNVVGMAAFKNHFGIWFFQGGLLKDEQKLLVNAQEGKTQAMRQMKFNSIEEVKADYITSYIQEAIQNVKDGKEIKPNKNKPLIIPLELQETLNSNADLKTAFDTLTKSKQREYAEHITEAKREATKVKRLEKIIPMILSGVGLHDKYKNC